MAAFFGDRWGSGVIRGLRAWAALLVLAGGPAHPGGHRPPRRPAKRHSVPARKAADPGKILNMEALAPFFEALRRVEGPGGSVARVMQFGDSHTAADYWSGRLRQRFQGRFGDAGPGLIMAGRPWRGYHHEGVNQASGLGWAGQSLRSRECDGWVGLAGASVLPASGEPYRLQAAFAEYRVHLLGGSGEAPVATVTPLPEAGAAPEAPAGIPAPLLQETLLPGGETLRIHGGGVPPDPQRRELALTLPPEARLLGVELRSGRPGVIYDELGLNGAELLDLERWKAPLLQALLAQARPDLLLLAYGTNDMGRTGQDPAEYEARARELFEALKRESGAAILVIGPLDRLGTRKRQRATLASGAAWVIRALRGAARAAGCAFWDARQAMGGPGSIQKWRRAGQAQRDLVHLTGPGYQRLGDLLADELLRGYSAAATPARIGGE